MTDIPIPFGAWEPDKAAHMSSSLTEATNVLPVAGAYAPVAGLFPTPGQVLPSASRGFFAIPQPDGSPLIYAATFNNIYRIAGGSPTLAYSGGAITSSYWRFAQFQGRTIAINPFVSPLSATTGMFTALGGTPPRAKAVAVVGDFLVLGNLQNDGVDGFQPNRVRWSGFDNPDTWGTSVGTQADFQPMPDIGGPVVAITGRELGTIYQRKCISRMQYVGPPNIFNFDVAEQQRGAVAAGAVCNAGDMDFFLSDDGFFAWNGAASTPIGTDRVDRWVKSRLDSSRLDAIVSAYDPQTRCVMWGIPEIGKTTVETIVAYSIGDDRWTTINVQIEGITSSLTLATPLESMPDPDSFGGSYDDPAFAGGSPILAAIDANHQYGTFSGPILPATLATGDFQSQAGSRTLVTGVRPLVDSVGVSVAVGERNQRPSDYVAWYSPVAANAVGVSPQRVDGRELRYRVQMPAGDTWQRAVGIEVSAKASGRR